MLLKRIRNFIEKHFYLDCTISPEICCPEDHDWINDAIINKEIFKIRKSEWNRGEILPHVICHNGCHAGKIARVNRKYIKLINN